MLRFATPAWLAAGALLTLVPIVLHLIAPRPPARAPLPTARFLEPENRARRHLSRRLHDLPLLLLRCAFLLLLGAALAGPRLAPPRAGTAHVVLADTALVDEARTRFGDDAVLVPVARGGWAAALRALPDAAIENTRADSVRVSTFLPMRWGAWTPGTSTLRAAWPSRIALDSGAVAAPEDSPAPIVIVAPAVAAADLRLALDALGVGSRATLAATAPADTAVAGTVVVAPETTGPTRTLIAGDVVRTDIPGRSLAAPAGAHALAAAWADGSPAALASRTGRTCTVTTGIALADPALRASGALPALLDRLLAACEIRAGPGADLPLDGAARAALAGASAAPRAAVADLPGADGEGRPLARWLLVAALAVALAETGLASRRDRGTAAPPAGTSPA